MPSIMPWKKWAYKPVGLAVDADADPEVEVDEKQDDQETAASSTSTTPLTGLHGHLRTATASAGGLFPLAATATAVLFFALFVFMPRPWLASDHPQQVAYYTCGNSTQDATAAGCRFDVMSYTWVHPNCFDQELMYEFLGESDWHWYLDEDNDTSLTLDDVTRGQHEYVYVTWKYYVTHCTYMWRKMHRSLLTSRELDSYVSDYRHTEQCERVLLDRERQLDSTSVMLVAKYPSCPVPK